MEDKEIVELYWQRSERAIAETADKYGSYCYTVAYRIVDNSEDADECVNDTWMGAWNSMPDKRPEKLLPYLGRIVRNFALKVVARRGADKRGGGEAELALEELEECVASGCDLQRDVENRELGQAIDGFLDTLGERDRSIFVCRYWYLATEQEIAGKTGLSRSGVNAALKRIREKLRDFLSEEGLCVIQNA